MSQILSYMHIQTRPTGPFLLASSKHNASLSLLKKKKLSTSYKSKCSNCNIACSDGRDSASIAEPVSKNIPGEVYIKRSMFPPDFTFGAGTSAYQVEGAWKEGGKGLSIWDTFTNKWPENIMDRKNGNIALDQYHRYKDDIKLMKEMGIDSYRFSISWPRILPDGTVKGGVNRDGIIYYNNLINELIENDIKPSVTLFHWDVPQALEDKYQGFLNKQIVNDFKDYCQVCFREFGDRVKNWMTINEPYTFSINGYSNGDFAPGHCCPKETYTVSHNLILAHAAAARLYKTHYQSIHGGEIGITLNCMWYKPYSDTYVDKAAVERAVEFVLGWYMDPLTKGEYPATMRELVGIRLPEFTKEESEMIKGSYDVLGLNYYTSRYAKNDLDSKSDNLIEELAERDGVPIGDLVMDMYVVPEGIKELLIYTKKKYNDPKIYITENGTMQGHEELPIKEMLLDKSRIKYISLHLAQIQDAIRQGVKVKGYYAWSLMDNFEWKYGYILRYGLIYIDYTKDLARTPKASANWYSKFLRS